MKEFDQDQEMMSQDVSRGPEKKAVRRPPFYRFRTVVCRLACWLSGLAGRAY
jgi:hypothetical protein